MELTDRWLGVDEIATYLGVAPVTIYRWLEKGKIPAHRIGKLWKFQATEVDSWVKQGGAADSGRIERQIKTEDRTGRA